MVVDGVVLVEEFGGLFRRERTRDRGGDQQESDQPGEGSRSEGGGEGV